MVVDWHYMIQLRNEAKWLNFRRDINVQVHIYNWTTLIQSLGQWYLCLPWILMPVLPVIGSHQLGPQVVDTYVCHGWYWCCCGWSCHWYHLYLDTCITYNQVHQHGPHTSDIYTLWTTFTHVYYYPKLSHTDLVPILTSPTSSVDHYEFLMELYETSEMLESIPETWYDGWGGCVSNWGKGETWGSEQLY